MLTMSCNNGTEQRPVQYQQHPIMQSEKDPAEALPIVKKIIPKKEKAKIKSSNGSTPSLSPESKENITWKQMNTQQKTPKHTVTHKESAYSVRIGAVCCDGSRSYATGRGACSHHGGVCQWLYQ